MCQRHDHPVAVVDNPRGPHRCSHPTGHTGRVRLFVAVSAPESVIGVLLGVDRPEVAGLRWTTEPQWHVTLRFLGEVDEPGPVAEALGAVPDRLPAHARGPGRPRARPRRGSPDAESFRFPWRASTRWPGEVTEVTAPWGEPRRRPPVLRAPDPGPGSGSSPRARRPGRARPWRHVARAGLRNWCLVGAGPLGPRRGLEADPVTAVDRGATGVPENNPPPNRCS